MNAPLDADAVVPFPAPRRSMILQTVLMILAVASAGTAVYAASIGNPGERDWKVLFLRRSLAPLTVDSSMVDPEDFTAALRTWRPEL